MRPFFPQHFPLFPFGTEKTGRFPAGNGTGAAFFSKKSPRSCKKGQKTPYIRKKDVERHCRRTGVSAALRGCGNEPGSGSTIVRQYPDFFAAGVEFSAKRCYLNRRAKSNERTLLYGLTEKTLFCGYSSICKNGSVTENANFRNRSPEACGMHFHKCTPSALVIGYWRTSVTMWSGCAFFVPPISQQRKGGNKSQFYFVSLVCLKPS